MPDHFVPLDTARYTKYHRELAAKGILIQQNLRYVDNNRKQLKKSYPDFDTFKTSYEVPQSFIEAIIQAGEKQGVKPKGDEETEKTMPLLKQQLKALVARDLWTMNEYYSIINESNDIIQKAIDYLTSN